MRITEFITEAANPAQQAAIAVNMKKHHQKPKGVAEGSLGTYVLNVMDAVTGEHWAIEIQASSPDMAKERAQQQGYKVLRIKEKGVAEGENWAKHNHKRVGGMSDKSVKSYRRSHPGSKIQTAVTTKPSKLKKGSKAAKRRASFCARMRGMKKHRTGAKTAHDPNSNINKSLRRWHCESIEELQELVMIAEQFIRNKKNEL